MSLSDSDRVYSEADALDPEAIEALISSIQPVIPRQTMRKQGEKHVFQSLGVNVTRVLLSYFDLEDFMKVTCVCRWLYRFGSDEGLLSRYSQIMERQNESVTIRMSIVDAWREQALISKPRPLHIDSVFDPALTSLFHVELIHSRLICFSLHRSRLYVWELKGRNNHIIDSFEAVDRVCDFAISSDGAALLGESKVVNIPYQWLHTSYQPKLTYTLSPSYSLSSALIRRPEASPWVAVSVQGSISIYSNSLELLHFYPYPLPIQDRSSVLLAPSSHFGLLLLTPTQLIRYKPALKLMKIGVLAQFISIVQADCMVIRRENQYKYYVITLGYDGKRRIYANNELLPQTDVNFFSISQNILLICQDFSQFTLYKADFSHIKQYFSFKTSLKFASIYSTSAHIILYQPSPVSFYNDKGQVVRYTEGQISFLTYRGGLIHSQKVENVDVSAVFPFRSDVVVVGNTAKCGNAGVVSVLRYFTDGKSRKTEEIVEENRKIIAKYIEKRLNENEKRTFWLLRRQENRENRKKIQELALQRLSKYWKNKKIAFITRFLREEIAIALRNIALNIVA